MLRINKRTPIYTNLQKCLTVMNGMITMSCFLDEYYERTDSDDIACLLSEIQIFNDGLPGDLAALSDWCKSIEKITQQKINREQIQEDKKKYLTTLEAFRVMEDYLEANVGRTSSDDIAAVIKDLRNVDNESLSNSPIWQRWCECVELVIEWANGKNT